MVVCNLAAQQVPFNAIFLISDPMQKWRLLANFVLYFLPFLAGALFLGVDLPEGRRRPSTASTSPISWARACAASSCCWRCTSSSPTTSSWRRCCCGWPAACCGSWRCGDRRGLLPIVVVAVLCGGRALRRAAGARHPQARGVGLQGRLLRPQVPGQPAHLRARLAVRLHGGLFQLLPAFRAGPVGQRRVQPPEHAGQRLSRPLHRFAKARRASSRTCRPTRRAYFRYPADVLPVRAEAGAGDLRRPVRRRHLDGGGAEVAARAASRSPRAIPRC